VPDFKAIFEQFQHVKVCVVGDVMIDSYVWGHVERISPEAPVPIVQVQKQEMRLGGAANVARNLLALGAEPLLCGVIGNDTAGQDFLQIMAAENLPTDGILTLKNRPTTLKHRILSGSQHLLRIDSETDRHISDIDRTHLSALVKKVSSTCQVMIFEDYDKGVLDEKLIADLIAFARQHNIPTIVDPKKRNFLHYRHATLFKPNLKELREGLKIDFNPADKSSLQKAISLLKEKLELEGVLATLSERGVYIDFRKEQHWLPAHIREIADVSGAGDTVVSIAALCLALGLSAEIIAGLSNLGGGIVCEYAGVVPVPRDRLLQEALSFIV
jgi:D-glycero-beta-D-manno-heptose-7-phosphate kinase